MKLKITQECGQRWYRRSSWHRPFWRLLRTKVIEKAEIVDISSSDVRFEIRKMRERVDGVECGPIMFFWRYGS